MTEKNDIEQLFKAHYTQMHHMAVALLHDDDLARDIVHDVFVNLLEGNPDFAVSGAYLIKAVKNRSLNYIRNCDIHQRIEKRYFLDSEEYDTEEWPNEEAIARIYHLIRNDISPKAGRIMQLRFSEELQFARIADIMGISETAVYRHLSHAITLIRKKLNEK